MARIRIKLRASTVSGKPGTIYYQVAHKKVVKQVTTGIHLLAEEWNKVEERIVMEALMKIPRLATLQRMIDEDVERIQLIIRSLELSGASFSTQDIVQVF